MIATVQQRLLSAKIFAYPSDTEKATITINGDMSATQLEMDFECTQSVSPDANVAKLRILNLAKPTRDKIAGVVKRNIDISSEIAMGKVSYISLGATPVIKATTINRGDCYVEIDGGFFPSPARLFQGSSNWTRHVKSGPNWITEMEIGDGLSTIMTGVAAREFPPGALLFDVVTYVVKTMALGLGNLSEDKILEIVGPGKATFPFGFTCFGDSKWLLTSLISPFGGEWFVDRGEIFFVIKGRPLMDNPATISFAQGMISSPEPADGGKLRVRSILRPDLRIGRRIAIVGSEYAGTYRAEVIHHTVNNRMGGAMTDVILSPGVDPF